jgi:hypothetical protein
MPSNLLVLDNFTMSTPSLKIGKQPIAIMLQVWRWCIGSQGKGMQANTLKAKIAHALYQLGILTNTYCHPEPFACSMVKFPASFTASIHYFQALRPF